MSTQRKNSFAWTNSFGRPTRCNGRPCVDPAAVQIHSYRESFVHVVVAADEDAVGVGGGIDRLRHRYNCYLGRRHFVNAIV